MLDWRSGIRLISDISVSKKTFDVSEDFESSLRHEWDL